MARTVLLVDDDPDFVLQQSMLLKAKGYSVVSADSVNDAMALLEKQRPDIAVIDLMMEFADSGFVLAHRMKQRYADLPVVMVTAVTSEAGVEFAAAIDNDKGWVKADAVLTKPVRGEQLIAEIERQLR
jgi:CheY-like chemotaxis protein